MTRQLGAMRQARRTLFLILSSLWLPSACEGTGLGGLSFRNLWAEAERTRSGPAVAFMSYTTLSRPQLRPLKCQGWHALAGLACFTVLCPWQTSPINCCPLPLLSSSPDLGFFPGLWAGSMNQSAGFLLGSGQAAQTCALLPARLPGLEELRFPPALLLGLRPGFQGEGRWRVFSGDMGCSPAAEPCRGESVTFVYPPEPVSPARSPAPAQRECSGRIPVLPSE